MRFSYIKYKTRKKETMMKSTKITTALVLLATISTAFAERTASERYDDCREENGRVICGTGTAVVGAGRVAGDIITAPFGGRRKDRQESNAKVCKHGNKRNKCKRCKKEQEEMTQDEMDEMNGE